VRYVALGDSYTIGEGVDPGERWPDRLVAHLRDDGLRAELVANPSVTGYTTRDVLEREVPVLADARADLATLQIGVNDWVQGADARQFRANFAVLLDEIAGHLSDPRALVVVTIPDLASTPAGTLYTGGRDGSAGIRAFNSIIRAEASMRGIPVADVFRSSRRVRVEPDLVSADGLHPSAKQYAEWERVVYPVVRRVLSQPR
jgi:acyl-CoA thioesterase I